MPQAVSFPLMLFHSCYWANKLTSFPCECYSIFSGQMGLSAFPTSSTLRLENREVSQLWRLGAA